MKTSPSAESGRRADRLLPGGAKAPSAVHFFGVSPRSGPFRWGQRLPRHGAVVRGQTQKFLTPAAKSFVAGTSLPWTTETCCGRFSPRKVHSGKQAAGVAAEGLTAPSGAVALHTVRCAGSAVSGATGAARPERSLQAWFFRHRTVAAARNRASGFGGDWRVRQQLPVGVGPDDRMPPGSREPKVSPPPEIRTTETT
ncbi:MULTISPECIES: hypothetical protein [Escherichia]|nr:MULTISPECIES: hypothetical protein [Escherichia]EEE4528731.1 hypothetical protein [Salmonella enterica subsp. enterica serovar Enteritidis]EGL3975195.1 hypothetical protein [Salmonella enterica subsp. enterica serovar Java]WFX79254.1 hypothetical protein NFK13_26100 [Escherichia coli]WFZ22044.1 hypothetical protein NFK56_24560 [Escherichia coli]HAH6378925.1 hypothetical protein [Escherichia coli]